MLWFFLVIGAHLINAFVFLIDKYILKETRISDPTVFAFWVGLTSFALLVLIPFGFTADIPMSLMIYALLAGAVYIYGLIPLYAAIKRVDVSDAAPFHGAVTPIYTITLSFIILSEIPTNSKLIAFLLLVIGGLAIAFRKRKLGIDFLYIQISALLIALSLVLTKYVFLDLDFINGLLWIRIGMIGSALAMLTLNPLRKKIFASFRETTTRSKKLFVLDKFTAGTAALMLVYAISLGSVSLINALQGVQYVFLFILVFLLARKYPFMKEEKLFKLHLAQKVFGLGLVVVGLFVLGFSL